MLSGGKRVRRNPIYAFYQRGLRRSLTAESLPKHVGMIFDGNRRWARQLGLETAAHGHRAGAAKIREFLIWCDELGIEVVTLYLLSTDNLSGRESSELSALIEIIAELADDLSRFRNWRIMHVGSNDGLPEGLVQALDAAQTRTAGNTGLHVNLAVGYGGRHEIADAMRSIVASHHLQGGTIEDLAAVLTPELISEHLYTVGQPDPDLVIRTSGEQRMSDFLLWQSAHSELYFVEALGPDLREVDFLRALRDYSNRNRRYGT
ncbi:isoprenyl transferase [Amnibacterium flavum]|uniref:Isoprenyl transferase n=1 Tax=Amnibacterium flavum TaxID=2173173 RepID=A0A2V1HQN5_9MICO|nr:isoprenyl transferase [Amnibacterium flavum]PVZ94838.1 isoprenyl transferase [Amnibacterium flavum]